MRYSQSVKRKYRQHVANAKYKGIGFELTIDQWVTIWSDALGPKWEKLRHNNSPDGFVMARIGDEGPYAEGNVKIITHSQNIQERKTSVALRETARKNAVKRNKTAKQRRATSEWLTGRRKINGRWEGRAIQ